MIDLFEYSVLREKCLPILRNDIKISETYQHPLDRTKLSIDISVLNATDDKTQGNYDIYRWDELTKNKCTVYNFEGGHFFINEHIEKVIHIIQSNLCNQIKI